MQHFTLLIILFFCTVINTILPQQYSWRYYRPGNTGIQGDQATALWIDENGDPYIAAATGGWGEGGFAKFIQSENKWINYSNVDYPVLGSFDNADVQILDIVKDYEGNLWMGNYAGAVKFNPQVGATSLENYGPNNSSLQGFTFDVDLAPDSTIWFTSGGLVRFSPEDNQWMNWQGSNTRIAVQPKLDGSYLVWSADTYFGQVFTYNSSTNQLTDYLPTAIGDVAGLPGKDCVDDSGNFWALRMAQNGDWETLEYQRPDGAWIYPTPPYANVSFYIDAFKAFGNGKAVMVLTSGEAWMFDGITWNNFGTWRPGDFNLSIDIDNQNNVWVCGLGGAAKRDAATGNWQRYRITNTSQIDYFVEDISIDDQGNVWMTGNAGTGVGGFQKFDGERWTGFNQYTYGLGYPFPYDADNTQAIYYRPSNSNVVFNPTFHGIHSWDGANFFALADSFSTSKGFTEDSQGRLWSLGEYYNLRYFDETISDWIDVPIAGSGKSIIRDQTLPGTIWASTDYEILRTDGTTSFSRTIEDFPGSAAWFTELAVDNNGIAWIGTYSQFTSTGSTLIRLDTNTGLYTTFEHDLGWPFPGDHVYPRLVTPDGKLWLMYDSEYPSTEAGLCWYDGTNVGIIPASPGGVPQWGGLPNSNIRELEYKAVAGGYELWMSCKGRGIAVLKYLQSNPITTFQLTVSVENGWNMVSVPGLHPTDQNVNTWWQYRDLGANVFRYAGGYQPVTDAVPGIGYWMKHAGALTYNTGGEWPAGGINVVPHDPISGASGWNLIGGYELSVTAANVTTNPPGLQSGPIYKYSGGYSVATTIDPGYGYWIKLNAAGQIIIPETMAKGEAVEYFPADWGRIILTDATGINYTLYAVKGEVNLDDYELPPAPPTGMFDIRFNSGRIAEDINSSVKTIDMSGVTYPLTVSVEGMDIRLMDETGKNVNVNLKAGEDIVISDASVMKLMVSGELVPAQYALEQNYPNPFNPSTTINFSLPESVDNVKLTIYSILGEKVAELVNTALTAGKYRYQWNAQNVATGMYIYELRTDNFVSVKKMILLK